MRTETMPHVFIPPQARDLTGGRDRIDVPGGRVRQVVDELERLYPGMKARLCDGDSLRPGLVVVVGTEVARLGLAQPVEPDTEVHFLPAVGGGSPPPC
jgi:molybdopterin synthase sulfur carrier subunit